MQADVRKDIIDYCVNKGFAVQKDNITNFVIGYFLANVIGENQFH